MGGRGRVGERVVLNSVALGLSAEIARTLTPDLKRRLGLLAWPVADAKVLWRHRALDLDVTRETGQLRLRARQLLVANGRYVAGPLRGRRWPTGNSTCWPSGTGGS